MAKASYMKVLAESMNQPAIENCTMTFDEIKSAIEAISKRLVGPLSNAERLLLVAERSELRATLKSLAVSAGKGDTGK